MIHPEQESPLKSTRQVALWLLWRRKRAQRRHPSCWELTSVRELPALSAQPLCGSPMGPCLSPAPKQLFHPKKLERMLQETAALPSWLRSGKGREKNSCPWPPPTGPSRYPGNFRSHLTGARQRGQPPRAQTPWSASK